VVRNRLTFEETQPAQGIWRRLKINKVIDLNGASIAACLQSSAQTGDEQGLIDTAPGV